MIDQRFGTYAIAIVFSCIGLMACASEPDDFERRVEQTVRAERTLHPQATLTDLYKFFFQGAFGPGHLIESEDAARAYLLRELEQAVAYDTVLWQPVGLDSTYYRVNLKLLRDSVFTEQAYVAAFVESANLATPPGGEAWRETWARILAVITAMNLNLPDFEQDRQYIEEALRREEWALHHSEAYRTAHHPHYRIIHRSLLRFLVPGS